MARAAPLYMTEPQKDFMKKLRQIEVNERKGVRDALSDVIGMAYFAIKKTTLFPGSPASDECEKAYMDIVGRFHEPKDSARLAAECLGLITMALDRELHDFMGTIHMEVAGNASMGQFFTPFALCTLMAEMTYIPLVQELSVDDYITADEPAAGSGGLVVGCAAACASRGINFSRQVVWRVTELDTLAYRGCYVQLSLCGINTLVVHGNTLTLETYDSAITPVRLLHPRPFRKPVVVRSRQRPSRYVEKTT